MEVENRLNKGEKEKNKKLNYTRILYFFVVIN